MVSSAQILQVTFVFFEVIPLKLKKKVTIKGRYVSEFIFANLE